MLIYLIILLLAFPVGFLIAWLARDELKQGRKWFLRLMVLSVLFGIIFLFLRIYYVSWTLGFIFVVAGISWMKSRERTYIMKNKKR